MCLFLEHVCKMTLLEGALGRYERPWSEEGRSFCLCLCKMFGLVWEALGGFKRTKKYLFVEHPTTFRTSTPARVEGRVRPAGHNVGLRGSGGSAG